MTEVIIRDAFNQVINIGSWDYNTIYIPQETTDENGDLIIVDVPFHQNPLPEGAYEDMAEIGVREDGTRYVIETD